MLVQRDTLRMVHLLYNFFSPAVPWEGIKALTCGCGIIQEKCDDLGQEGLWVKRKPMNTILECFPLSGWDLAHFRGRHVTVSVTSRTAVLNNQLEEESAVELMEKCIFLAFIPRFWFPCDTLYALYPISYMGKELFKNRYVYVHKWITFLHSRNYQNICKSTILQ